MDDERDFTRRTYEVEPMAMMVRRGKKGKLEGFFFPGLVLVVVVLVEVLEVEERRWWTWVGDDRSRGVMGKTRPSRRIRGVDRGEESGILCLSGLSACFSCENNTGQVK